MWLGGSLSMNWQESTPDLNRFEVTALPSLQASHGPGAKIQVCVRFAFMFMCGYVQVSMRLKVNLKTFWGHAMFVSLEDVLASAVQYTSHGEWDEEVGRPIWLYTIAIHCSLPLKRWPVIEVLTRFHRMRGDRTLWLPGVFGHFRLEKDQSCPVSLSTTAVGTDHAGIATQMLVAGDSFSYFFFAMSILMPFTSHRFEQFHYGSQVFALWELLQLALRNGSLQLRALRISLRDSKQIQWEHVGAPCSSRIPGSHHVSPLVSDPLRSPGVKKLEEKNSWEGLCPQKILVAILNTCLYVPCFTFFILFPSCLSLQSLVAGVGVERWKGWRYRGIHSIDPIQWSTFYRLPLRALIKFWCPLQSTSVSRWIKCDAWVLLPIGRGSSALSVEDHTPFLPQPRCMESWGNLPWTNTWAQQQGSWQLQVVRCSFNFNCHQNSTVQACIAVLISQ